MSEEEIKCPYCDADCNLWEDLCSHVLAIIDLGDSTVLGPAEVLFDPSTVGAIDDEDLAYEMRIKYFDKFQEACGGLSGHYMKEFFDSGGPGTAAFYEWFWVKDVQSSLISLEEKLNKITL